MAIRTAHLCTMTTREQLRSLIAPIAATVACQRRAARRLTVVDRGRFVMAIGSVMLALGGYHRLAMLGILLAVIGWLTSIHLRAVSRLRLVANRHWLDQAIELDLTRDGREALTALLLKPEVPLEDAMSWANAELCRPLPASMAAAVPEPYASLTTRRTSLSRYSDYRAAWGGRGPRRPPHGSANLDAPIHVGSIVRGASIVGNTAFRSHRYDRPAAPVRAHVSRS